MVVGRRSPMVYQYALSSMVAIVGAALTAKAPLEATLLRIVLTMGGAITAALLTSLLEALIGVPSMRARPLEYGRAR